MLLLHALVRVLSFLLLLALALLGGAVALFCLQSGTDGLSLPNGAKLLGLSAVWDDLGTGLQTVEAGEALAVLIGFGALALGLLLLLGVFVPRRERLVRVAGDDPVAARRRPLAQAATALAEQAEGITTAKAKVRPGRRTGGRLKLSARVAASSSPDAARTAVEQGLEPVAGPFGLKTRVRVVPGGKGRRVQ